MFFIIFVLNINKRRDKKISDNIYMQKATDSFKDFLKNGNHRITPERFEVLEFALSSNDHFTADELYLRMKDSKSNVSRATVYNSLELLSKSGMLAKRNFGANKTFYESSYNRKNHIHLVCTVCGEIIESDITEISKIVDKITDENNFMKESFQFNIFGRCKKHFK